MKHISVVRRLALCAVVVSSCVGGAIAAPVFQGRLADGTASDTCTVAGVTKCTMFYNPTRNITILNNWNIGRGAWSATAVAGSAQALAASAGLAASGLTGWVLPTGYAFQLAGNDNQYLSIWNQVGNSAASLGAQFDGVQPFFYWSSTESDLGRAFLINANAGFQYAIQSDAQFYAVAVRPGDVTAVAEPAAIPEPATLALVGAALFGLAASRRSWPATPTA